MNPPKGASPSAPELSEDAHAIIAIAAHELKNALGGIGVALARCEQRVSRDKPVTADDLGLARAELRRLSALVNDLLDGARVDMGVVHIRPAVFDLTALAREVVEMFQAARGRPVRLDLPLGPVTVEADAERVRGVLINYLENAFKYAPAPAGISVVVGSSPAGDGVRLSVCDQGPGISPLDQANLFQRFYRGPTAAKRTHGLGLGLYLCRAIAEAHGGAVGVVSTPGAGATFWLDLPAPSSSE
ncbi:MAG TPA: HAMP domain-containing sensor histidine kinase [Polyangia bacterium]